MPKMGSSNQRLALLRAVIGDLGLFQIATVISDLHYLASEIHRLSESRKRTGQKSYMGGFVGLT